MNTVFISEDNSKHVGPSVSLRPVADCRNCRWCARVCYARRFAASRASVRETWDGNSLLARTAQWRYFEAINGWLAWKNPDTFRWHVAGDILDQNYVDRMYDTARRFPGTAFLCITKRHDLFFRPRPENLSIVLSFFPKMPDPPARNAHLPRAYLLQDRDGIVDGRADGATPCPGRCDTCRLCWRLKAGEAVVCTLR